MVLQRFKIYVISDLIFISGPFLQIIYEDIYR